MEAAYSVSRTRINEVTTEDGTAAGIMDEGVKCSGYPSQANERDGILVASDLFALHRALKQALRRSGPNQPIDQSVQCLFRALSKLETKHASSTTGSQSVPVSARFTIQGWNSAVAGK
ncbi:hypothetical protein MMC07_000467 [Pseudocyphellaria aurata]|nr:hypothetical protein [Pseudocyphellaria aurata]